MRSPTRKAELPPLGDDPSVSVVIPARNSAGTLREAVASALTQDDVDEVVVAVGPSSDGTRDIAEHLATESPRVKVVDNPDGSTPAALNRAIRAARGEVLVRLDAHATLPPGYVARAVEVLRDTGAANVGGRQVPTADDGFAAAVAAAMGSTLGSGGAAYRTGTRPGPVDTVYLGVFRREALDAVGGFDETMIRNQDAELNLRLRRAGYEVWFDPTLAVDYRPRGAVADLARQYHQYGRWRRVTARVHPGSLAVRQLAAPALVVGLVGAVLLSLATRRAWPVGLAGGGYLAVVAGAAVKAAPSVRQAPATGLALMVMHLAWGVGFLQGPPRGGGTVPATADETPGGP